METMAEVYLGTFELREHEDCPLLDYSRMTELDIDVNKHFPAYHKELCGIIFNIPAQRTQSEIEALAGNNLRIRGVQTYDDSTIVIGTMRDEITNFMLYSSDFSTVIEQSFHKNGTERISVATIDQVQLDYLLEGLAKLIGEDSVIYTGAEKRHLIDFVENPLTEPLIITQDEELIINKAMGMGFLDIPRKIDLGELATHLGTTKGSLSPKMREIYKKVLKAYIHRVTKM